MTASKCNTCGHNYPCMCRQPLGQFKTVHENAVLINPPNPIEDIEKFLKQKREEFTEQTEKLLAQRKIKELIKKYPNDLELGREIRKMFADEI